MSFNSSYLPKSDVVFTVMFLNKELCEKTLQIILGEEIQLKDIQVESKNDLHQAALNSIYFDVRTQALDGRIITLDLQRKYIKDRVRKRTVYYACREIASQPVVHSEYENLKSVVVSFLLTEATLKSTTDDSKIILKNDKTGEPYTDLLTIHEINIRHITNRNSLEMQILKAFLEISTEQDYYNFINRYKNNDFGKLLIKNYDIAVSNSTLLEKLGKEDKFMIRLTEEERLKEQEIGEQRGLKEGKLETAKNMINEKLPIDLISKVTGLTVEEIKKIS